MNSDTSDPRAPMITTHNFLADMFRPHGSGHLRKLLLVIIILCPVTAILYIACAFKRIQKDGFWLVRIDKAGYICPNIYLIVPGLSVCFCTITLAGLIQLLKNIETNLPYSSIVLNLTSYALLLAIAWTKVWGIILAIPPSKMGLQTFNFQRAVRPNYLSPKIMNSLSVLAYTFPTVYLVVMSRVQCQTISKINSIWHDYNLVFQEIMKPLTSKEQIIDDSLSALQLIEPLQGLSDKALFYIKAISFGYAFTLTLFLLSALIAYFRIVQALCHQLKFLKLGIERTNQLSLEVIVDSNHNNHLINPTQQSNPFHKNDANEWESAAISTLEKNVMKFNQGKTAYNSETSQSLRDNSKRMTTCFARLILPHKPLRYYLPYFQQGTEVDATLWHSLSKLCSNDSLEITPKDIMERQSQALRKYAINTIWQGIFACIAMGSFLILTILLLSNTFDYPKTVTLIDLHFIIILWCNIAYNLGLGLCLSLIACIVTFTKTPYTSQEQNFFEDDK
ncbi:hypothetical protein O181_048499 [Austropuccinia psidii MF-1]|uniref:Uncharacterized protein n=1 Tax=Austropuccinia psidii MF-1 TaxID=1389203 RepID=A0A9Q3DT43_9BASI|nr:hypothetical protein [Austropuccinia psidii MF-1]